MKTALLPFETALKSESDQYDCDRVSYNIKSTVN